MRNISQIARASLASILLSGCATTSFAPPVVNMTHPTKVQSQSQARCAAQIVADATKVIDPDVEGARALINNFVLAYRCRAHSAADGRQWFEVPSLLVAAGTVTAAAFGASPDVAIAGGAASAILANGKAYYSPQQKASIYDHALDALLCIKTEAVGVTAFDTAAAPNAAFGSGGVEVDPNVQYFDMVTAALLSVERILAQRLSNTGTFDAAGLIAEIEAVKKKVDDAEKAKDDAVRAAAGGANAFMDSPAGVRLDLDVIQPKLQQCVVRAKL